MDIIELELREHVFKKVAEWNAIDRLIVTRSSEELQSQKAATLQSKVFTVITRTGMPYLELVQSEEILTGNDRYEGFVKDLMDEIAKVKNITYKLKLVSNNQPGRHDPVTGKWNGMIGEVIEGVCIVLLVYSLQLITLFSFFREPIWQLVISQSLTNEKQCLTFRVHS